MKCSTQCSQIPILSEASAATPYQLQQPTRACAPLQGFSCEAFQALPPHQRSAEDAAFLNLSAALRWKRCPSCRYMVGRSAGCNHMSCRCGTPGQARPGARGRARGGRGGPGRQHHWQAHALSQVTAWILSRSGGSDPSGCVQVPLEGLLRQSMLSWRSLSA
jgi:hypothetical protein